MTRSSRPETAEYKDEPDGDLMTVEEYLSDVSCGGLTDYDGMGYPVKNGKVAPANFIYPSDGDSTIPLDATYIDWYNR